MQLLKPRWLLTIILWESRCTVRISMQCLMNGWILHLLIISSKSTSIITRWIHCSAWQLIRIRDPKSTSRPSTSPLPHPRTRFIKRQRNSWQPRTRTSSLWKDTNTSLLRLSLRDLWAGESVWLTAFSWMMETTPFSHREVAEALTTVPVAQCKELVLIHSWCSRSQELASGLVSFCLIRIRCLWSLTRLERLWTQIRPGLALLFVRQVETLIFSFSTALATWTSFANTKKSLDNQKWCHNGHMVSFLYPLLIRIWL